MKVEIKQSQIKDGISVTLYNVEKDNFIIVNAKYKEIDGCVIVVR